MNKKWKRLIAFAGVLVLVAGVFVVKMVMDNTSHRQVGEGDIPLQVKEFHVEELKEYGIPMMLNFGSEACEPYKAMQPALTSMYKKMEGKVAIQYIDVWENPRGGQDYPIQVIPTQFFYDKEGNPFVPSDELKKEIEFTLYENPDTGEHEFTFHQGKLTEEQMEKIFAEMGVK